MPSENLPTLLVFHFYQPAIVVSSSKIRIEADGFVVVGTTYNFALELVSDDIYALINFQYLGEL